MKVTETIFDIITQETTIVERELTKQEIAERDDAAKAQAQREAEAEAKATARAAILDRLGLTEEEAVILLG
jgi:hypothetical protein